MHRSHRCFDILGLVCGEGAVIAYYNYTRLKYLAVTYCKRLVGRFHVGCHCCAGAGCNLPIFEFQIKRTHTSARRRRPARPMPSAVVQCTYMYSMLHVHVRTQWPWRGVRVHIDISRAWR